MNIWIRVDTDSQEEYFSLLSEIRRLGMCRVNPIRCTICVSVSEHTATLLTVKYANSKIRTYSTLDELEEEYNTETVSPIETDSETNARYSWYFSRLIPLV